MFELSGWKLKNDGEDPSRTVLHPFIWAPQTQAPDRENPQNKSQKTFETEKIDYNILSIFHWDLLGTALASFYIYYLQGKSAR